MVRHSYTQFRYCLFEYLYLLLLVLRDVVPVENHATIVVFWLVDPVPARWLDQIGFGRGYCVGVLLVVEWVFRVVHVWVLNGLLEGLAVLLEGESLPIEVGFGSILNIGHVLVEI